MKIQYNVEFDAYYDAHTDEWTDAPCSDKTCEFCTKRPTKPSMCASEKEDDMLPIMLSNDFYNTL